MNKKGLTLLEIIVSTLLLAIVMAGLTNIFLSGKRYLLHSRSRMSGGELGKLFLDPLQMYIRQDTWNQVGNALNTQVSYCDDNGSHPQNPACPQNASSRTLAPITYSVEYNTTTPDAAHPNIRRVVANITWNEPQ
jgi:prepilin-type N-terminal cleavage/methylation domain-containing protein